MISHASPGLRVTVPASLHCSAERSRHHQAVTAVSTRAPGVRSSPVVVEIQGKGEEWKLEPIVQMLREGKVGIIPTDSLPAIVADLENREAVMKLYQVKKMSPKKPLSLLCRSLADIAHYTTGFPVNNEAGSKNWFGTVKKILPGPYTIILPASKNLPRQIIEKMKDKTVTQHRRSVGVRISDEPVCQSILESLGTPLLCTSVNAVLLDKASSGKQEEDGDSGGGGRGGGRGGRKGGSGSAGVESNQEAWVPDLGSMLESFPLVDFIVDVGPRLVQVSTVVDMTGNVPEVVRVGRGDPSYFEQD